MNDCINIHCKEYGDKVKKLTIIHIKKICKSIPKIKTIEDIEEKFKDYQKIKDNLFYKKQQDCEKQKCKIDKKKLANLLKSPIMLIINIIKNEIEKDLTKYPYWNELNKKINKLLMKPTINSDELFKLSYYAIILSCMIDNLFKIKNKDKKFGKLYEHTSYQI